MPQLLRFFLLLNEEIHRDIAGDGDDNAEFEACSGQTGDDVRSLLASALFSQSDELDVALDHGEGSLDVVLDDGHHAGGHGGDVGEVDGDQVGDDGGGEAVEDEAGPVTLHTAAQLV